MSHRYERWTGPPFKLVLAHSVFLRRVVYFLFLLITFNYISAPVIYHYSLRRRRFEDVEPDKSSPTAADTAPEFHDLENDSMRVEDEEKEE